MEELRALHQVAYVRFASVYREFKDVGEFMSELETILDEDAEEAKAARDREGVDDASVTDPGTR